jgi:hypothetical protein
MNRTLNLLLSAALVANMISCKTTEAPEATLAAAKNETQEVGSEVFGCYKVKLVDSQSKQPEVTQLKSKATKVCLNKNPLTLLITDKENKEVLTWKFKSLEPLRCPSCYNLKGGNEYSATITRTIVPTIFNISLETRGFGGDVRLTLEQIINNTASSSEPASKIKTITCGDHWRKITGIMPTSSTGAVIKISGDSQQNALMIPAKIVRKGGELIFEATDRSAATLRIITEGGKYYGVFRDSKLNDDSDLGQCYADVAEEHPLN